MIHPWSLIYSGIPGPRSLGRPSDESRVRAFLVFIVKLKLRLSHVLDEFHQIYACTVTLNFFTYCTYYNKYNIRLNNFCFPSSMLGRNAVAYNRDHQYGGMWIMDWGGRRRVLGDFIKIGEAGQLKKSVTDVSLYYHKTTNQRVRWRLGQGSSGVLIWKI